MATKNDHLLEEYKVLEGRHHNDTNRIWAQAQTLVTANFVAFTLLGTLFSSLKSGLGLFSFAVIITGIAFIGFAVCGAWFFSLRTDRKYQKVTEDFLLQMEKDLKLPFKAFSKAKEKRREFEWPNIGGSDALYVLCIIFNLIWLVLVVFGLSLLFSALFLVH